MYDELPNSSGIVLNMTHLSKVNIEEYYLVVNSNLSIGGLYVGAPLPGPIFDILRRYAAGIGGTFLDRRARILDTLVASKLRLVPYELSALWLGCLRASLLLVSPTQ
eukprot:6213778-Pleurochrysis_carterae.AAC.1